MAGTPNQMTPQQQQSYNNAARALIQQNAVPMILTLPSQAVNPANGNVLNFTPQNVGITKGFLVVVTATLANTAAAALTLTGFGASNLVNQVTYTDLQNLNRVQTTGYHLAMLSSLRQGWVFAGAYAPNVPMGYGNNWQVQSGPSTIAVSTNATVKAMFWVPLAYSNNDLRGAAYTNIVNATQNLQIVLNQNPCGAAGADPLGYIYTGNAAATYSGNVSVAVYQFILDQIPTVNGQPILPLDDFNTVYDIKNTTLGAITQNADFPFVYPNMRQFLSTLAIFDNGGTFNTGSDVNYWSLVSANSTTLFKVDPYVQALFARHQLMTDPPAGVYVFDTRAKPIDTISYGNMALNLNASTVNAGAKLVICTEAFQQTNQIPYASSLNMN